MGFKKNSTLFKVDVVLMFIAAASGILALWAWRLNTFVEVRGFDLTACILYPKDDIQNAACAFSVGATAAIILGALALGVMEFVIWKRNGGFKSKRVSITAIVLGAFLTLLSLATLAVVIIGDIKLCQFYKYCRRVKQQTGILSGIGACGVACFTFAVYTALERVQYARRQKNDEKQQEGQE